MLGNWKVGKNCKLKLTYESGLMNVIMTADLGGWINNGHQGPRRKAGQVTCADRKRKHLKE